MGRRSKHTSSSSSKRRRRKSKDSESEYESESKSHSYSDESGDSSPRRNSSKRRERNSRNRGRTRRRDWSSDGSSGNSDGNDSDRGRKRRKITEEEIAEYLAKKAQGKAMNVAKKLKAQSVSGYSNDSNPFGDSNLNEKVGDGSVAGSSAYVDDEVGACGATGDGDIMMRLVSN